VLVAALIVLLIGVVLILVFRPVGAPRPPSAPVTHNEADEATRPDDRRLPSTAHPSEDSAARRDRVTRETQAARQQFRRRQRRRRRRRAWLLAACLVLVLVLVVVLAVVASTARAM
jgi:cytochrome c-type biogenesis protein CcmH/NrfG